MADAGTGKGARSETLPNKSEWLRCRPHSRAVSLPPQDSPRLSSEKSQDDSNQKLKIRIKRSKSIAKFLEKEVKEELSVKSHRWLKSAAYLRQSLWTKKAWECECAKPAEERHPAMRWYDCLVEAVAIAAARQRCVLSWPILDVLPLAEISPITTPRIADRQLE